MIRRLPAKIDVELFLLAAGTIVVLTGIFLLIFPSQVATTPLDITLSRRQLWGTLFTLVGITFFVIHSYPTIHRLLQWVLAILISFPLFFLAYGFFKTGTWAWASTWAFLGLASLGVPLFRWASATDEEVKEIDLLVLVAFIFEVTLGSLMLLAPAGFPAISNPLLAPLGLAFLVGAGFLATSLALKLSSGPRALLHLAAALPLAFLAFLLARVNAFTGVAIYGISAVLLVFEPLMGKGYFPHELDGYPLTHKQLRLAHYEQVNEATSWGVAILLIILGLFPRWLEINHGFFYLLILIYALFLIIWYHFLPPELLSRKKVVASVSIFAVFAAVINHFTGALESPFFFLYFLPIVAAGYALPPRALLTPLIIIVLALNLEWTIAIYQNGLGIFGTREAVFAAFRYATLVLIGLSTYGLSAKREENSKLE